MKNVSIVIPTYNKSSRLNIMIESLCQEIEKLDSEFKVEVLIIDDGSTDNTKKVIEKYNDRIPLKYIYQNNSGLSCARNTGIKNSSFSNLLFLDDDRVICDGYLSSLFTCKADIVFGKRKEWYIRDFEENFSETLSIVANSKEKLRNKTTNSRYYVKTRPLYYSDNNCIPWIGCTFANTLIKKEVFDKVGLFSDSFVGWGFEDIDLSYRAYKEGFSFVLNEDMISYHLFHQHSKSILEQREKNYKIFLERNNEYPVQLYYDFFHNNISLKDYNQKVYEYYENNKQ